MEPANFEQLIDEHGGPVHRVCRSILRDEHLGDDAAQETFVRLWQRIRRHGPPDSIGGWIRRAAVSASLDLARRRRVRDTATRAVVQRATSASVESRDTPDSAAAAHELRRRYEAALNVLSDGQRTVFALRNDAGLPLRDIAEMLGLSLSTVKTQFARACVRLQAILAAFGDSDSDMTEEPRQ